jgi:hypothetical protein
VIKAKAKPGSEVVSILAARAIDRKNDRLFFVGMAAAIAATVVIGFTWSFLRTDLAKQLHSPWVKAHAGAFIAWILLFFCQTILVAKQRIDIHRRLGIVGGILAGLMISLALGSAFAGFHGSPPRPVLDYFMLYVVVHVDIIMFATLVTAGLLHRQRPETHKRLMFLATIALLDAVTERLPLVGHVSGYASYAILDMFVVCGILYDLWSRGQVNRAYLWGGLLIFIFPPASRIIFVATVPHLIGIGRPA